MGASTFNNIGTGISAKEAFRDLLDQSRSEDGISYSGCIGMKSSFVTIECPKGKEPQIYAEELIEKGDHRVKDKHGPAGCIKLEDGKWLFFGWASS